MFCLIPLRVCRAPSDVKIILRRYRHQAQWDLSQRTLGSVHIAVIMVQAPILQPTATLWPRGINPAPQCILQQMGFENLRHLLLEWQPTSPLHQ